MKRDAPDLHPGPVLDPVFSGAGSSAHSWASLGLAAAFALGTLALVQLIYSALYWVHPDLAGAVLSGRLVLTLQESFDDYTVFFPPAERVWFTFAAAISEWTGMRLDLAAVLLTNTAVLISAGLGYHIRRVTAGASLRFFAGSLLILALMPIAYMSNFGLREHIVLLGLWPYLVLRISDPEGTIVGWRLRFAIGLWMGSALLLKYLYSVVVVLVELADAAIQRRPFALLRIENLVSGAIVAAYLFIWLVLDPSQREAIEVVVTAINANLVDLQTSVVRAVYSLALAVALVLVARLANVPVRVTAIGLAIVLGAVIVAWIQSRWYVQHRLPITAAYIVWLWMMRDHLKPLWFAGLALLISVPVINAFRSAAYYQASASEIDAAMKTSGFSVEGKRVGVLNMNPSPVNQFLAANRAWRWNTSVNNSYVAAELVSFDRPENAGQAPPSVTLEEPGLKLVHDAMLRLWEDSPPDALILDNSRSWPLRFVKVRWREAFARDERFNAFMEQYEPVLDHKGELLDFTYFERKTRKR